MTEQAEYSENPAVVDAIHSILRPMGNPVRHGDFNRRMVLEALFIQAGQGCSMEADDIKAYAAITDKEFDTIITEYVASGVIKSQKNMFDIIMYSLDM